MLECTMLEGTHVSAALLYVCAGYIMQSAAYCTMPAWTQIPAMLLQGSIDHTTCEYQRLIDQAPDTIIPARPFTVHDRVYDAGDPLGGNFCPYNSSTPLQPCKKVPHAFLNCFQNGIASSTIHSITMCQPLPPS